MEEKILEKLEIIRKEITKGQENLKSELKNDFEQSQKELKTELRNDFKQSQEQLKSELKNDFEQSREQLKSELREEFNKKIDEQTKLLLDRQFLFEQEYGTKINAIFDSVSMEMDKNLEKSDKIRKLEKRMDITETKLFNYEKRISSLEKIN